MGKYFGTDGFRGEANVTLTGEQAYRIGRFLGWYFTSPLAENADASHRTKIVIGKDTRRSSYMFEYALAAGIAASGADAYMLHVTTTPSVSFVTRIEDFDCGVMISASHNAYSDNGIKIVNSNGEKIDDRLIELLEGCIDADMHRLGVSDADLPLASGRSIGSITDYAAGRNRYVGHLISTCANSLRSLRIGLDCANGSAWMIARSVFEALGAKVYAIGDQPDGVNINENCGSTHIEGLQKLVREKKLDVGFAFDGDADRCLAVDENGEVVNGDHILFIMARRLRDKDALSGNTVAATVMSNIGLRRALEKEGINLVQTAVGDRFIYEEMVKHGYQAGGEQSGHIILRKYAVTGDGILTAIKLTEEMLDRKMPLSKLASAVVMFPQYQKSIRVRDKRRVMQNERIRRRMEQIEKELGTGGRILLRPSGTEPVIRVMVEAEEMQLCERYVQEMLDLICAQGLSE